MNKLKQARKSWPDKSDEWLYERLSNELTDKVSTIHKLLNQIEILSITVHNIHKLILPKENNPNLDNLKK